jgi:hypothetical protein
MPDDLELEEGTEEEVAFPDELEEDELLGDVDEEEEEEEASDEF